MGLHRTVGSDAPLCAGLDGIGSGSGLDGVDGIGWMEWGGAGWCAMR